MPTEKTAALPQSQDWNRFWRLERTDKFTKISWSKRRVIQVLQPFIRQGKRVLDAGCGSGFFSQYFSNQEMPTLSLDYSDEALDITRERTSGQTKIMKQDLLSCDLQNIMEERFDLIFTDGLFEHFPSEAQDKIMVNLINVLSGNGVIITFVPNRWSPWELIRPFFMPGIEEKPFVLSELVFLNKRNGLYILSAGGVNTLPLHWSPDKCCGHRWGMLLYTVAQKPNGLPHCYC